MTSNPPGECCRQGFMHRGIITGEMIKVGNANAYIAKPPTSIAKKGALIYVTDVLGTYENSKLLADEFAAVGYLTIMPDLFNGGQLLQSELSDPKTGQTSLEKWIEEGFTRIGAVGYCFCAKYVVRFLKHGFFDAGFIAHPSYVTAEELTAVQRPVSIAVAETDSIFPAKNRHESEEILKKIGSQYQITLYAGVQHGFAVRADLSERPKRFAKETAFKQAINWFDEWLENSP